MERKRKNKYSKITIISNVVIVLNVLFIMYCAMNTNNMVVRVFNLALVGILLTLLYIDSIIRKKANRRIAELEYVIEKIESEIERLEKEDES